MILSIFSMKEMPISSDQSGKWRKKLGVGSGLRKSEEQMLRGGPQRILRAQRHTEDPAQAGAGLWGFPPAPSSPAGSTWKVIEALNQGQGSTGQNENWGLMTETLFYLLHSIFWTLNDPCHVCFCFLSHLLVNVRSLRQGFCPSRCQTEPAPGTVPGH